MSDRLPNIHPGEVLLEEFLKPFGLSQNRVAREIGVPPRRINEIVLAKRTIMPDTALRLAHYFGTSERFWLGLQTTTTSKRRDSRWKVDSSERSNPSNR